MPLAFGPLPDDDARTLVEGLADGAACSKAFERLRRSARDT